MCISLSPPAMKALPAPPPIQPNVDKDYSELPAKKDIVKPGDETSVKYGGTQKKSGQAAAGQSGAQLLKIDLNTGTGSNTGGLNV